MFTRRPKAIRCLKRMFPNKTIVADTKCADAGGTVARNVAQAGADFMTVICCATLPTMAAAQRSPRITSRTIWRLDNATSSTMARIRD